MVIPTTDELVELVGRSFWTFVKVFLGGLTLTGTGIVDVEATKVAAIAGAGAVLGLLQVYAAQKLDGGNTTAARLMRGG
jgi:hypothetical protein